MSDWKKVKIGDVCEIIKGATGIASAEPGEYPLVVTAVERKHVHRLNLIVKQFVFLLFLLADMEKNLLIMCIIKKENLH